MANYFSAQILQEYLSKVKTLASSLNIPSERIVFNSKGCHVGSIGVYIKFESKVSLDEFSKKLEEIPCILEKW